MAKLSFYGWGTAQDYGRALRFLNEMNWNYWEADYLRGMIYGQGLGVAADIPKAIACLQKAGDHPEVKEELRHYKKSFFGKWSRR